MFELRGAGKTFKQHPNTMGTKAYNGQIRPHKGKSFCIAMDTKRQPIEQGKKGFLPLTHVTVHFFKYTKN